MHHKSPEEAFPSKVHELEAHEAQIVQGSDRLCGCFPSSQLFGGSSSTHSDRGSPLTPFPPAWTRDITNVWKAPYSKTLQGRQEVLLGQSRLGGCLAASRPCSRSLRAAGNTPRAEGHHQITHLLISISRGHQLCSVPAGEQSPVGASDLPLQEQNPQVNTSSSLQPVLVQSTSTAHTPHCWSLGFLKE